MQLGPLEPLVRKVRLFAQLSLRPHALPFALPPPLSSYPFSLLTPAHPLLSLCCRLSYLLINVNRSDFEFRISLIHANQKS